MSGHDAVHVGSDPADDRGAAGPELGRNRSCDLRASAGRDQADFVADDAVIAWTSALWLTIFRVDQSESAIGRPAGQGMESPATAPVGLMTPTAD